MYSALWLLSGFFFFFNDTATTEIYTLSLHDALPISPTHAPRSIRPSWKPPRPPASPSSGWCSTSRPTCRGRRRSPTGTSRSEEHTSELQSRQYLVCRLLLEKKKKNNAMKKKHIQLYQ